MRYFIARSLKTRPSKRINVLRKFCSEMKLHFNLTIAFSECSLKRLSVKTTLTSYSLPLHLTILSICVKSMLKLEMHARKTCQ